MNRVLHISIITVIIVLTLASCRVEKRIYRKGYHIVWNNNKTKPTKTNTAKASVKLVEAPPEVIVVASADNHNEVAPLKQKPVLLLKDTCGDVLLLQNADELHVKITEIDESTIKYKRCDNIDGPTYSISKSKVALIKYANGTKEVVQQEPPTKPNTPAQTDKPVGPRKVNILGLASLLSYVALSVLSRSFIATGLSSSMAIFLILLSVAPLIMAYISLFQFKREPERYTGRWMPITVVVLYLAGILILALLLAALSTYYSGGAAGITPIIVICLLIFLGLLALLIAALTPAKTNPINKR